MNKSCNVNDFLRKRSVSPAEFPVAILNRQLKFLRISNHVLRLILFSFRQLKKLSFQTFVSILNIYVQSIEARATSFAMLVARVHCIYLIDVTTNPPITFNLSTCYRTSSYAFILEWTNTIHVNVKIHGACMHAIESKVSRNPRVNSL